MELKGAIKMKEEKNPSEMVDIELLEKYSHYCKMGFRLPEEQNYLALLRREMLERMAQNKK